MDIAPAHIPLLVLAGFVAGLVNVIAGGGSLLTLPVLMWSGVSAEVANGTNRVAILLQAVTATKAFTDRERFNFRLFIQLLPLLLAGAALGAWLATQISPQHLKPAFGGLFIGLGLLSLAERRVTNAVLSWPASVRLVRHPLLFLVGVYGGFLQAGVGLWVVLAAVALFGANFKEANSVKLPLVLGFTLPALFVFTQAGHVEPVRASLLALGTGLGAWVGVKFALASAEKVLRVTVAVAMILTGALFLF
jgi:uncharacterized protein